MLAGMIAGSVVVTWTWWTAATAWTWFALIGAAVTAAVAVAVTALTPQRADG
jgi:hypothetical protein